MLTEKIQLSRIYKSVKKSKKRSLFRAFEFFSLQIRIEAFTANKVQLIIENEHKFVTIKQEEIIKRMYKKLTTGEKLKDLRVARHLKLEEVSKETNIAASTLSNYENDEILDISAANILALADYYDVSTDYVLGRTESRFERKTEIEGLNLDDETIRILKENRLNNRLLCELIKDPDFVRFMTDIEIYVDGIAQRRINDLNSYVNVVQNQIIEKHTPNENDLQLKTLEVAKIDEGYYFADRIHRDIDPIIHRIRTIHEQDETSMPPSSAEQEIIDALKEADRFKGSDDEKLVAVMCHQLGINYSSLTQEEFQVLIKAFKKSKKYKSGVSRRGKKKKY